MTVSLKIQIETAERKYAEAAQWLEVQREMIEELKSRRLECNHEFDRPLKGYEHEGGYCKHCGINEVYQACNKKAKNEYSNLALTQTTCDTPPDCTGWGGS